MLDISKCISLTENNILIQMSLTFFSEGPIDNKLELV